MITSHTKVRPRVRQSVAPARPVESPSLTPSPENNDRGLPPLTVLARLPEVTVAEKPSAAARRLQWLHRFEWKGHHRLRLDPNWVAGSVLGIVLVLLLIITLNRSPKNNDQTPAPTDAPAWNAGKVMPPNPAGSSIEQVSVEGNKPASVEEAKSREPIMAANPAETSLNGTTYRPNIESPATPGTAEQTAPVSALDGIAYPQTPFPPIGGPARSVSATGSPPAGYGGEIRTAQRDGARFGHPEPQYRGARFDGTITQP
jgi:hypothetical protein